MSARYPQDPIGPFFRNRHGNYCATYNEAAEITREQALASCVAGIEWLATPEELTAIIQRLTSIR